MIEAIQTVRDVVVILSFVIITATVVMVGRNILHLLRKAEAVRTSATAVFGTVMNPAKGVRRALLALSRRAAR